MPGSTEGYFNKEVARKFGVDPSRLEGEKGEGGKIAEIGRVLARGAN